MAEKMSSFDDVTARLDEIVDVVRKKDTSLERSLELFEEAVKLGSNAVDLVDVADAREDSALNGEDAPEEN